MDWSQSENIILNNLMKLVKDDKINWSRRTYSTFLEGPDYWSGKIFIDKNELSYDNNVIVEGYFKLMPLRKEIKKSTDRQWEASERNKKEKSMLEIMDLLGKTN